MMINVEEMVRIQAEQVENWHVQLVLDEERVPMSLIQENNHWNYRLWHEEDIARIPDISPGMMVTVKRNIDRFNQQRNDAIERIDEWILWSLNARKINPGEHLHSETPGMMIDRLSIMALKLYHMREETLRPDATDIHRSDSSSKVCLLNEQIGDLAACLKAVLANLERGALKFKVYRQLKMYNDPDFNPQLYQRFGG